jgi:hypothetical protein
MRAIPSILCVVAASGSLIVSAVSAPNFFFNSGVPDGKIAMATNPANGTNPERETGDDFILGTRTEINHAFFYGIITGSSTPSFSDVVTEIYRVFPKDSQDPPDGKVPTRKNSPSDIAFESRDLSSGDFTVTMATLGRFTAENSVLNNISVNGANPPVPVTGQEVVFDIRFSNPIDLPADHYFFVPQVEGANGGQFFWLSAAKPIVGPGTTPFLDPKTDLQTWIRNEALAPNWLRVGTDIVGGDPAPTFNASFGLEGIEVPESNSLWLIGAAAAIGVFVVRRRRRSAA